MSNFGYFKFPRELLNSSNWKSLSLEYRYIYTIILSNVAYEKTTQNDHGKIIEVKPGQMLVTYREIVRLCDHKDIDLPLVQRALKRFKEIGFSIQETIHIKTLITVTEPIVCKIWFDLNDTRNDTHFDTRTIQERYTKEEVKKERRKEEQYISRKALIENVDFLNSSEVVEIASQNDNIKRNIYSYQTKQTETNKKDIETKDNNNIENKTKSKQKKEPPSEIAFQLLDFFCQSLKNVYPKCGSLIKMAKKRTEMGRHFDEMLESYEDSEIKKCIEFGHLDNFWKSNIIDPKKLKKHIDTLHAKSGESHETIKGNIKRPSSCKNATFKPNPRKFLDANAE